MRSRIAFVALVLAVACSRAQRVADGEPHPKRLTFSILEDYDKGQDLADVARDFDLFHELGVTTWRGSFGWDDYEPTRGVYDFEWLNRFASMAESRGITLRPYIGYTPAWAAAGGKDGQPWNDPPADLEAWSRFVRTLVGEMRQHRNIPSYEIYNEENAPLWWDGPPAAYGEVLRRGVEAVKAANPEALVLFGGMTFPDTNWLDALCERTDSGRRVDIIPFHAYPETWTPNGVTLETYLGSSFESGFVADADAACGRKAVWINETGYATTPGRTEADQANWWARAMATFAGEPRIEHIGIYEIKDAPRDRPVIGDAPNYFLGITDVNRRKKLAFATVKYLVAVLGDWPIVASRPAIAPLGSRSAPVHAWLFTRDDGRRFLFVWSRDGDAVVDIDLRVSASQAIEHAIDGRPAGAMTVTNGRLSQVSLRAGAVRLFEIAR